MKSNQISFNANTQPVSLSLRRPKPPSSLGLQTSSQETFSLYVMVGDPDQRNALYMLSMVSRQPLGSRNAELQKFTVLVITVLMSCRRPAKKSALCVHEKNFLRS